ncbi:MAG: PilZ domain-containing protein [Myxococcota bacterium]|nr:PilZ domain-containing protein [Myxococcota bacterium]
MDPEEFGTSAFESRVHERVAVDLPVDVTLAGYGHPLSARTRDLSAGGLCLATESPIAVGDIRSVRIHLENGSSVEVDAEGKRQTVPAAERSVLTSVQFVRVEEARRKQLQGLVEDRSAKLAEFLSRSELEGIRPDEAMGLTGVTRLRNVPTRTHLYHQGAQESGTCTSLYVVSTGEIALDVRLGRGGNRTMALAKLGPGAIFGGLSLVADVPMLESAWAEYDASLIEISAGAFRYLRIARPLLAQAMSEAAVRRHADRLQALFRRL